MAEIIITNENFDREVLSSDKPVMVDFWATWCGPCKMLASVVEEISKQYADTLKVGKVNVDEQPELAARYKIGNIPTVIVFKDGKPVNTSVGYKPKEELIKLI